MAKRSNSKGIIKDIAIVVVAVVIMWIGIQVVFGTEMLTLEGNQIKVGGPFYVVVSGSMIPVLQVYDIIVIQGHDPFEEVEIQSGKCSECGFINKDESKFCEECGTKI